MSWTAGLWICSQMRYRWGHSGIYLINIKKKICSTDLGKIFTLNFVEFLSKPLRTKYFLFGQVTYFINKCYRIRDVTVFAILIQISFKLNHDIDRLKLSII